MGDVDMLHDVQMLTKLLERILSIVGRRMLFYAEDTNLKGDIKEAVKYVRDHYPS